jgi:YD repeat-containing protein
VRILSVIGALLGLTIGAHSGASETITYKYDAKGRLIKVVHTGSVNNNATTDYTHDKANNRKTIVRAGTP